MIPFTTLTPKLLEIAAALTGLHAELDDGQRTFGAATCYVKVFGIVGLGTDDRTYERADDIEIPIGGDAPAGGQSKPLRETMHGPRELTLRLKVETFDHTGGSNAEEYTERARTRSGWTSMHALYDAAGLAFGSVLAASPLATTYDERVASVAFIDFRFAINGSETDPTLYASIDAAEGIEKV